MLGFTLFKTPPLEVNVVLTVQAEKKGGDPDAMKLEKIY